MILSRARCVIHVMIFSVCLFWWRDVMMRFRSRHDPECGVDEVTGENLGRLERLLAFVQTPYVSCSFTCHILTAACSA